MIGTEIGSYRILEQIGQGGMGVVYKAVDTGLDRFVAMKVLNPDLSRNPELVSRFRAEAKAQANLNHTNLATLYAFLVQDGTAVMVMEYVDGETFAQMIRRRGPIPEQEAVPLFRQALLGIGYAHRAGILHRDIKPSNLMLNKNGLVKVMDFGIAKVMGVQGMTRTGTQLGTLD
jgi:serine/threonine protein kinase